MSFNTARSRAVGPIVTSLHAECLPDAPLVFVPGFLLRPCRGQSAPVREQNLGPIAVRPAVDVRPFVLDCRFRTRHAFTCVLLVSCSSRSPVDTAQAMTWYLGLPLGVFFSGRSRPTRIPRRSWRRIGRQRGLGRGRTRGARRGTWTGARVLAESRLAPERTGARESGEPMEGPVGGYGQDVRFSTCCSR